MVDSVTVTCCDLGEVQRSSCDVMNASPSNDVTSISPRDLILTPPSDDFIQLQPPASFSNSNEVTEYSKETPKLTDSEYMDPFRAIRTFSASSLHLRINVHKHPNMTFVASASASYRFLEPIPLLADIFNLSWLFSIG